MKIGFLLDTFEPGTPGQQLLDRFLLGYPRDGAFRRPDCQVQAFLPRANDHPTVRRRVEDDGLVLASDGQSLTAWVDALVVVLATPSETRDNQIADALENVKKGTRVFIHGTLGGSVAAAERHRGIAKERRLQLLVGTATSVASRLPPVEIAVGEPLKEALVVVQGAFPVAELDGLEILLPLIERRPGDARGIRSVSFRAGDLVWQAAADRRWSWDLLGAALSRSDSPQGDAVKDGRTQDLVRLGLIPSLARNPRAWLIEHEDGLRSSLLVLDGVVADQNFAVRTARGDVISAQVYQPPHPAQNRFNRLAPAIEAFVFEGKEPWPLARSLLTVELLEAFGRAGRS